MTEPIRILLVDDQQLVRLGFRMVLEAEQDLTVVGEAADGAQAVRLADELRPDVVLMDVRMPALDGLEATRRIVDANPAARIIILTTFDLDEYAFGGLRAGASGFLLKDARPQELAAAVRAVAAGDAVVSGRVTRAMLELFADRLPAGGTGGASGHDPAAALTPREREILVAMGEGLSNGEIGARFYLTESTVKTHVGRVLAKLHLRDRVHAVIFAYEHGLLER
ncbi:MULTISPECIES: response regulator transcription factor [unclassified Leifsonia]|uniref:response regulator n=1 Tax=unclassified Leifsonia TaxID=2663824 RepID=UPI0008A7A60A|nr:MULTISPECIES: response regulator transcription factor [unclassified Leifsonia]SEI08643.1 DNA-binding response regulator, NarL/FixJ family, contains REC and HTH domains [Leifsonia sp. CL154]SFL83285.1 DNA-binding response regulator, NarL/FixJ family, contains REC and HTH domains [Leifsonia sp. CL147]